MVIKQVLELVSGALSDLSLSRLVLVATASQQNEIVVALPSPSDAYKRARAQAHTSATGGSRWANGHTKHKQGPNP